MLTYADLLKPITSDVKSLKLSSDPVSIICGHCTALIPDFSKVEKYRLIRLTYDRTDVFPDFPALLASVNLGCQFCGLLRYAIQSTWGSGRMEEWYRGTLHPKDAYWTDLWDREWDGRVRIGKGSYSLEMNTASNDTRGIIGNGLTTLAFEVGPWEFSRMLEKGEDGHNKISQSVAFKVLSSGENADAISQRRLPSQVALAPSNLKLVSQWIETCVTEHTSCRVDGPLWLPTRVIDVGPPSGEQEPRLIDTEGKEGLYICLSHCWGPPSSQGHNFKTTSHNFQQRQKSIPVPTMPQNFQDATKTARQLGIRFLWIDAYCIIQDSRGDFEKEVAQMSKIFAQAHIVIVATSATASTQGFLARTPPPTATLPSPIPNTQLHLLPTSAEDTGMWIGDIESSTWNTRAWCLQERLLARRVLHFASSKLYYECRTTSATEEHEPPLRKPLLAPWPAEAHQSTAAGTQLPLQHSVREAMYQRWYKIVHEYMKRQLTVSADKLPALSGLAAEMCRLIGPSEKYLAGLWRGDLHRGLLWQAEGVSLRKDASEPYRAPSWSWASLDGRIGWRQANWDSTTSSSLEILHAEVHVPGLDPTGCVVSGHLDVSAMMFPVHWICEVDEYARWFSGDRATYPYDLEIGGSKIGEGHLDLDDLGRLSGELWFLEIHPGGRPAGLIVESVEDNNREVDVFRRGGIATLKDMDGKAFGNFDTMLRRRKVRLV